MVGLVYGAKMDVAAVVEKAGIAKVVGQLAADFDTSHSVCRDSSGCREIGQVCLVEQILALSGIVVGGKSNLALVCGHCPRDVVLVERDHSHQTSCDCECSGRPSGVRCLRIQDSHGTARGCRLDSQRNVEMSVSAGLP